MKRLILAFMIVLGLIAAFSSADVAAKRKTKKNSALKKVLTSSSKQLEEKIAEIDALNPRSGAEVRGIGDVWEDVFEKHTKRPHDTHAAVLRKLEEFIGDLDEKEIIDDLHEDVVDIKIPSRLRTAYFTAVRNDDDDDSVGPLAIKLADDAYTTLRMAGIEELGERIYPKGFEVCMRRLNDAVSRVRRTALDALEIYAGENDEWKEAVVTELVISFIQKKVNRGQPLFHARKILENLTGEKLGGDPEAWVQWWRKQRAENEGRKVKTAGDGFKSKRKRVWDVETASTKLIFVIDTSVSMEAPIPVKVVPASGGQSAEEKRRTKGIDWTKVKTRLDLARAELLQYINMMEPDEHFTIVSYSTGVNIWKETIVPATPENVEEAHKYMNKLKTSKLTNIYGAIDSAIGIAEAEIKKANDPKEAKKRAKAAKKRKKKRDAGDTKTGEEEEEDYEFLVPDTIIFLTDGYATTGKYMGTERGGAKEYAKTMVTMLKEIKARNAVAKMTIHAVAIGDKPDKKTLKALARQNKGDYRHITEGGNAKKKEGEK